MAANKKPALQAATPNDFEDSAFVGDDAHDTLTARMNSTEHPNRTMVVGIAVTTESGGRDAAGARVTKWKFEHLEMGLNAEDDKAIQDLLVSIHRRRTMQDEVKALKPETKDVQLDGTEVPDDDVPDVDA
jgi:hypothetical protein